MTKIKERTKTNKLLLLIYIILVLVIPVTALFVSIGTTKSLDVYTSFLGKSSRVLYVFVSLPIYAVYANIIIKELFPTSPKKVFYLFIPILATYVIQFFEKGLDEFWDFMIINSLPLYLGLNLLFIIGLFYLIVINAKGENTKSIIGRVIASLIIMTLMFTPPIYFFIIGLEMHTEGLFSYALTRNIVSYVFTILLMAFFHYKIVIELYDKGAL